MVNSLGSPKFTKMNNKNISNINTFYLVILKINLFETLTEVQNLKLFLPQK